MNELDQLIFPDTQKERMLVAPDNKIKSKLIKTQNFF